VRNLDTCVRSAHLDVKSIVASPVATGMACLTDEERELGVALVELGAGVTNVSLFVGGVLVGLASVGIGAADITDDVASAFGTKRHHAERLKCFHGSATTSPRDNHDMIDVAPLGPNDELAGEPHRVRRAELIAVIRHRLDELTARIEEGLKAQGFPRGRQIVLTGGGAELKGIADYLQGALGRAVRVGRPKGLAGLPEAHSGPAFATLAGLVRYAASDPTDLRDLAGGPQTVHRAAGSGVVGRLMAAFRGGY
jgi:cell division protein FtsA